MSDALRGWLNFSAGLAFDYAEKFGKTFYINGFDSTKFIQKFPKLSNKTLLGITLRGVFVGILSEVVYEVSYAVTKWAATDLTKAIHGWYINDKENAKELYEMDWFVESADTILPFVLNDLSGNKLQTVIGFNYLLSTTLKGLDIENTADLFGDEEYKDFDAEKVVSVYQKIHALFSGNNGAQSIKNLDDLAIALQDEAVQELFKSHRGSEIQVFNASTIDTMLALADKDSKLAMAVRYAFKHLNPFVIQGKTIDYSQFNTKGELDLYSPTNPNGMTETYLQHRAEMLKTLIWQNAVPPVLTDAEAPFNPNPYYYDVSSKTEVSLGGNGAPSGKQIIFGTNQSDTDVLQGGSKEDFLFGGAGNDTLSGQDGQDYLEGGTDFDTYNIQGHDTVFDSDMQGTLLFPKSSLFGKGVQAASFKRDKNSTSAIWFNEDKSLVAMQSVNAADLLISQAGTANAVTVKDFFKLAKNNGSGGLTGLTVELDEAEQISHKVQRGAVGALNRYNLFYANDAKYTAIKGGNLDDVLFSGSAGMEAQMGEGNDRVFGSFSADRIEGEEGNDILNGSNFVPANTTKSQEELNRDADTIVGGAGRDLINGMAGDDIIHTGVEGEHASVQASGERGDWALGHLGNDYIYGSRGQDFLQGGEGIDTVFGGADDDVILGDGFIRFGTKGKNISGTMPSTSVEYVPVHHGSYGSFTPNIINLPGNALGVEHVLAAADENNKYKTTPLYSVSVTDKSNDEWSVTVDRENGDYSVHTAVALNNNEHRVAKGGNTDYLYGGAGNDLIIGQDGGDFLFGDEGDDILWGDDNRDAAVSGDDFLFGGEGNDKLYGGKGGDTLHGGVGHNILDGGEGSDSYILLQDEFNGLTHNVIKDSDGIGRILVGDVDLAAKTWHFDVQSQKWQTDNLNIYLKQNGSELLIMNEYAVVAATVEDFQNGKLGIELAENKAPVALSEPADLSTVEGLGIQYTLENVLFDDEDVAALTYEVTLADGSALPSWLHFDASSKTLSGVPQKGDAGRLALKITAKDSEGLTASIDWHIEVAAKPNEAPVAVAPSIVVPVFKENETFQYTLSDKLFTDDSEGALQYRITTKDGRNLPDWLRFDAHTRTLSGTPDFEAAGSYPLLLNATDAEGLSGSIALQLDILDNNRAPVAHGTIAGQTLTAKENWQYRLSPENYFRDEDKDDVLTYSVRLADGSSLPAWLKYDATSHTLSGVAPQKGAVHLQFVATDKAGEEAVQTFTLNVLEKSDNGGGTLLSGSLNEHLEGGIGDDTYVFGKQFGKDTVLNFNPQQQDKDVLKFTHTRLSDVTIRRHEADLLITQKDGQQVTVQNFFEQDGKGDYTIQEIQFADGKRLDTEQLRQWVVNPTRGSDTLYAYSEGGKLYGGDGHDTLIGNTGSDYLIGNSGNDILRGAKGNDRLEGGWGNDTYLFDLGDGNDRISDELGRDTLKLGSGIDAQNLWFSREGRDLHIQVLGQQDSITIEGWFAGISRRIETLQSDNGRSLDTAGVQKLVQAMASFAPQHGIQDSVHEQMMSFNRNIAVDTYWRS